MTMDEFLRLPRFLSTQNGNEPEEVVALSAFGIIPLIHSSESDEAEAAVPVIATLEGSRPVFATQLWVSVEHVKHLLGNPTALQEPTSFHDAGDYLVIVDGHHREAARRIAA